MTSTLNVTGKLESKNFWASHLTKFQIDRMEFGMLRRLVGLVNLMLMLSYLIHIQEREPC